MSTFQQIRDENLSLRTAWQNCENDWYDREQSMRLLRQQTEARRKDQGITSPLEEEPEWDRIQQLEQEIDELRRDKTQLRNALTNAAAKFDTLDNPQKLLANLQNNIPILLFPLRVQTRFVRVKHITKADRRHLLDISGAAAPVAEGVSADSGNWEGVDLKEILGLQQLRKEGDPNQKRLGELILGQLRRGLLRGNPTWLRPQADTYELLVRIYPDDIFVHSHEAHLSPEELQGGQDFWTTLWTIEATPADDDSGSKKRAALVAAWKKLQDNFLPARAAWIYRLTKPANFPPPPDQGFSGQPDFSQLDIPLRAADWTQPMRTYVLPERLVIRLYHHSGQTEEHLTNRIVYPLALSHNPLEEPDDPQNIPEDIKWMADLEAAEEIGMALKIPITREVYEKGISQLVVLGVNLTLDATAGKGALENLLYNHQYKEGGLAILPQGTPTNNFEQKRSGYSFFGPEPGQVFDAVHLGIPSGKNLHWSEKKDGHFLAELLQIDPAVVNNIFGAGTQDIAGARAMNSLLWPATLGYYLDQFFRPLCSPETLAATRQFFTTYVSGRGLLPALQVGHQPYGILLTTDYTQFDISRQEHPFLSKLYTEVLRPLDLYWDRLKDQVKYLHNLQGFDSTSSEGIHKYSPALAQMIDLHASSETFFFRPIIGEYFVWNTFRASFPDRKADIKIDDKTYLDKWATSFIWGGQGGREYYLPTELGTKLKRIFQHLAAHTKEALEKNRIFQQHHPLNFQQLTAQVIDPYPPVEHRKLSKLDGLSFNYLQQLLQQEAAQLSNLVRNGTSVADGEPKALLYLLARQALCRAYLEAGISLTNGKNTLISSLDFELEHLTNTPNPPPGKEAIRFIKKISSSTQVNDKLYKKNKWDYLEIPQVNEIDHQIKNLLESNPGKTLSEKLAEISAEVTPVALMKLALRHLSEHSTASLHRLFSEHIDLCSYRLDAWLQGLVHQRLQEERGNGIYLGAYGYVEQIEKGNAPAVIFRAVKEPQLIANSRGGFGNNSALNFSVIPILDFRSFARAGIDLDAALNHAWVYLGEDFGTEMEYDPDIPGKVVAAPIVAAHSQGFMHTPSQAHAITAAILRSGFVADNPEQNHDAFASNLSSARIRNALYLIEGVKNGQELPELLGYQFERYLHDQSTIPLDAYILDIRKRFPFKVGPDTPVDTTKPITDQQAYRVVDGWALTQFYRSIAPEQLKQHLGEAFNIAANHLEPFAAAIEQLNQNLDAVSDLLLSESVFQVARGNLSRAATALKMFNNEAELEQPEILKVPNPHQLLSHVIGIHFDHQNAGAAWPGPVSDRARVSPQLNHWLGTQLPAPEAVGISIESDGQIKKIHLQALQLQPLDFIDFFREQDALSDSSELSARIKSVAAEEFPEATTIGIRYRDRSGFEKFELSLFELKPLIQLLISLLQESRPMLPTDLQRSTQTDLQADHSMPTLDNTRLVQAFREIGLEASVDLIAGIEDRYVQWQALEHLGKQVFGDTMLIVPEFRPANEAEFNAAYNSPDLLSASENPLQAVHEWMQGAAQVRTPLKVLQQIGQFQNLFEHAASPKHFKIVQLPFNPDQDNYRWLGIAYPDHLQVEGDILSLALLGLEELDPAQPMSGLIIDHWREELPQEEAVTGIAMHYDQPNVEPPQVMLMCVAPKIKGAWNWENLSAIVTDTMDRAKKRGIDPDIIAGGLAGDGSAGGPLQYLLPGVVAPICENGETPWVNFSESENV